MDCEGDERKESEEARVDREEAKDEEEVAEEGERQGKRARDEDETGIRVGAHVPGTDAPMLQEAREGEKRDERCDQRRADGGRVMDSRAHSVAAGTAPAFALDEPKREVHCVARCGSERTNFLSR